MTAQNDDRTPAPAEADEPTKVLASRGEPTLVRDFVGEPTLVQDFDGEPTMMQGSDGGFTQVLASTEAVDSTQVLRAAGESAATLHLGLADGRSPSDEVGSADAEYSATVLASHWIQRPGPDGTLVEQTVEQPFTSTENRSTSPDRIEGTLLRFGPGVTNVVAHRTHRTLPALPPPRVPPRRRPRRHALPVLVMLGVLAFLAWQRLGPALSVSAVTVTARPTVLKCDGTADMVGVVATNGRPGTLSYRWTRSDGTASGVLRETVARGQRQARLHLLWTFQGKGHRTAQAELRILSEGRRTVTTRFTYDCS